MLKCRALRTHRVVGLLFRRLTNFAADLFVFRRACPDRAKPGGSVVIGITKIHGGTKPG